MAKILLVMPYLGQGRGYNFPLGIAYVSSALKRAGHQVKCLNLNHADASTEEAVARAIAEFAPDVCATGTISPYWNSAARILEAARTADGNIVTVLGGGILSASPEQAMQGLKVDIGVIGEGERTMVEIADAIDGGRDIRAIAGIVFRGQGEGIEHTPERPVERDLGTLPWPDFDSFDIQSLLNRQRTANSHFLHVCDEPRALPMISSRSCPYSCTFCFHPLGRVYRQRPLDDVFAELEHLIEAYQVNVVEILDELFTVKRDRLEEFCARIKPYGIRWGAQLHTATVDREVIRLMADANCVFLGLGLESIHPDVLASMKKKTTPGQIERALNLGFGKGMAVRGNFIFGDPAETLATANHTLDWWARNRRYQISLIPLMVLPGAPLYREAVAKGIIADDPAANTGRVVNLTRIDNDGYGRLLTRIRIFEQTLLIPAKVLSFENDGEDEPHRHRVRWACPNCGAENDYRNVFADMADGFQSLRLGCRACGAYGDVRNMARPLLRDETAEAHLAEGLRLRGLGRMTEAAIELRTAAEVPGDGFDEPEAATTAALVLGQMCLKVGKVPLAVHYLGRALLRRAFDPLSHEAFAAAVLAEGYPGAAALHHRQARLLGDCLGLERPHPAADTLGKAIAQAMPPGSPPRYV